MVRRIFAPSNFKVKSIPAIGRVPDALPIAYFHSCAHSTENAQKKMSDSTKKCTIQEASRTLKIDRRKIYRMIDKGLISKLSEDGKTFVLLEELRAIYAQVAQESAQEHSECTEVHTEESTHFFVEKNHYESLLVRLGQLESERRYLLEYKGGLDAKDKELAQIRAENERLKAEVDKLKARRSWWERLFSRK